MMKPVVFGLMLATLAVGCNDTSDEIVAVQFRATVGSEPFVCGQTYEGLGSDDATLELADFRFYVQDIELRTADGTYVPLQLRDDPFQVDDIVLLDFEDGCGEMGNSDLNEVATGTASGGPFVGVRFQMGIPFTQNHADPATAPSPLNLSTMNWNWQGGYKFLRIDSGSFSDGGWRMHLGSTGCDGDPQSGGTTSCANPNRVPVELDLDPLADVVVADFARLVEGAPLDTNQPDTPFGCMSGVNDSDCQPLFDNLGLAFGGQDPPGDQIFFSAEPL